MKAIKKKEEGKRVIFAPAGTDFFCNNGTVPEEALRRNHCTMHPIIMQIEGDFVQLSKFLMTSKTSMTLLLLWSWKIWTTGQKVCFEKTDFGTHTTISVVTKQGYSDDANGSNISGNTA